MLKEHKTAATEFENKTCRGEGNIPLDMVEGYMEHKHCEEVLSSLSVLKIAADRIEPCEYDRHWSIVMRKLLGAMSGCDNPLQYSPYLPDKKLLTEQLVAYDNLMDYVQVFTVMKRPDDDVYQATVKKLLINFMNLYEAYRMKFLEAQRSFWKLTEAETENLTKAVDKKNNK